MMKSKGMKLLACACVCFAATADATLYQWTGNGSNHFWDNCENWGTCGGIPGLGPWPNSTSDDAIIDGEYDVSFKDGFPNIDDLTFMGGEEIHIWGVVDADSPVLGVDVLTIQGSNNPADGDTVVRVGSRALIVTYDN